MFYRTERKDQIQNQTRRYNALTLQISLLKSAYLKANDGEPTHVYLTLEDCDFVKSYHEIMQIQRRLTEKSTHEIQGMKIKVGSQIEVNVKEDQSISWAMCERRNSR